MKTYEIIIRAIVTKTMRVEAENEDAAVEIAHGDFTTACIDDNEDYDEQTLSVEEVSE